MPLEIAISWDPVLNLPYIPSSSLKGAVRAWLEVNNVRRIDGVDIGDVFGRAGEKEAHISLAVFTDAYPVSCVNKLIEPDVISPHYKGEDIAEVDANPVPLVFPTIAPGTTMKFILALRFSLDNKQLLDPQKAVNIAQHVVKALENGVGAKTSVGYGRVRPVIAESKVR
jgi:CRISPR-associated protein Cmr6